MLRVAMRLGAGFAVLVSCSVECFSSSVAPVNGQLSINTGAGFKNIKTTTSVKAGDMIMAGPSGKAELVYDDGCLVPVEAGAVVIVSAVSPCKAGSSASAGTDPVIGGLTIVAVAGGAAAVSSFGVSNNGASP